MAWYVVFRGRKPGVYRDWQDCNEQVSGFPNCSFRSYPNRDEAVAAYLAYSAKQDAAGSAYQIGAFSGENCPVAHAAALTAGNIHAGPSTAEAFPQAHNAETGVSAAAEPDLVPVLLILVALLIAVVGYHLN